MPVAAAVARHRRPFCLTTGAGRLLLVVALSAGTSAVRLHAQARPTTTTPGTPAAATDPEGRRLASFPARYAAIAAARGADTTRLRRLLALDWERTMMESPEYATYTGYPGQNARWTDLSIAAVQRRRRELQGPLLAIRSIDRAKLPQRDQLNHDLFRRNAEEAVAGARFRGEYLQITQMDGPQYLADVIATQPAVTVADFEAMIARLDALPRLIDQSIALLDSGLATGITPPRVTLRDVPAQVAGLTAATDPMASPLLRPFVKLPASIAAAEQARLRAAAVRAYTERAAPAYRTLHSYLEQRYLPGARTSISASALPDGAAWYAFNVRRETTVDRTPAEIHATGVAEVRRLRGEMDVLMKRTGFTGSFAEFIAFLRTDKRFYHTDSASLVRAYRDIAKRIDPGLVQLFGTLPRLPYGVVTIPSYQAKSQTTAYYQQGTLAAGRPGSYFVNTYALDTRPIWEMEALSLHEAVPGHHLQIAIAQELVDVPDFRRNGRYTAFIEGWALYAESLGPALGMYEDPYAQFGQLTYEMWRAIRLVLDTGLHSQGWTRERAIAFFTENSAKTPHDIAVEVDRYIVWPGQALAYKTGQLQILAMRRQAEAALGDRFDVRAFHDELLGQGPLPLDVLQQRMDAWLAKQKGMPVAATQAATAIHGRGAR